MRLGEDFLVPISAADENGHARYTLPGDQDSPIPYLAFRVTDLKRRPRAQSCVSKFANVREHPKVLPRHALCDGDCRATFDSRTQLLRAII